MPNFFDGVSITGYNQSPPPDDGSKTSNNLITWSKPKTELADPLKSAIESMSSELVAAFQDVPVIVDTIAEMTATAKGGVPSNTVLVRGYSAAGDGGGGIFRWVSGDTTTEDFGTVFEAGAGGDGRWKRVYSGPVNVLWFGADDSGTTDSTTAFANARDAASSIIVPQGTYRIEGLDPGNRKHWIGVGTRQNGSVLQSQTLNTDIFSYSELAESTFTGLNFDASAAGVKAFGQTTFANYTQNCNWDNCVFFQSLRYGIYGNLILNDIENCNFMQHGAAQGSQDKTAIYAEFSGGSLTVNTNAVRNTNIYNTQGVGVYIKRGFLWKFDHVTFESLTDAAVEALGVDMLHFTDCWFEGINDVDHAVDLQLSTVGSRAFFYNCQFQNNNTTNTFSQVVSLGSACFAGFRHCAGNMASASLTLKSGTADAGLLFSEANNLTNYTGPYSDALLPEKLIIRSAVEPFRITKTGLSDTPASPETVATFTAGSDPGSQDTYMASVVCEAAVSAVAGADDYAQNVQTLKIRIFRDSGGVVSASLTSANSDDNVGSGGAWTAGPTWSVNVSGSDVQLKVTSDPTGGDFTGGITAVVTGTVHNFDTTGDGRLATFA